LQPAAKKSVSLSSGERMTRSFAALLLPVVLFLSVPSRADDIKEADYPVQYEVVMTAKDGKLPVEKKCSMTLRDKSKPDVAINVWKKGVGSCQLLDSGMVYRGRQNDKKNQIEIVIPVGETKARIDAWQIIGTVNLKPQSERPGS
jgi:hypothetical protein